MSELDPFDVTRDMVSGDLVSPSDAVPDQLPVQISRYKIDRILGKGGFGMVYLAHDSQLNRPVAIKVPHPHLITEPGDAEVYLAEAQMVANLDHPHIVPVFDVGSTDEYPCYIVSKFVEGTDLSTRLKQQRLTFTQSAELVAIIADALHYAHKKGLVHRDVKPGNILLDTDGRPYIVDFGLALREENIGTGPRLAGTPVYMSPEQARGEGHRVDGRSDIFSLGIVLYQLMVGRRPFKAETQQELITQITVMEARPPRQIDDSIPKEIERICMKAISKRASDRYMTARDFADDLRYFVQGNRSSHTTSVSSVTNLAPSEDSDPTQAGSDLDTSRVTSQSQLINVVPKGLRSFDAHDADFFLELLPGPRDRSGLPDSLRFWKTRIEETDPDDTFAIGLIYGPSGCGKSSLVKAGLLPRLSEDVVSVYIEATPDETESRLLHGLRKHCRDLDANLDLKGTLTALRRGHGVPAGKKVLIVLDQFEQWLHAKKDEENTELVQALRQCDGGRLQCIVMVRDDFWLAVSRFLRDLEVRLIEGGNSALVDLFDLEHARRVLAAFGRAFGKFPGTEKGSHTAQKNFVKQSVAGLSAEGKVICVRLALFAEMMKGKPWTPATLKAVGGTTGVGATFLEETFGSSTAPPEYRYHQKAVRTVLSALLPDAGTDIKGEMKSYGELIKVSGYESRQKDFDDLMHILDTETRLITPTDPEGVSAEDEDSIAHTQAGQKYYQLAHDYLVRSLRDWLTRKQKETRRGRAELKLAERSALWNANPENRALPSLGEHLSIRLLTDKSQWTPPQKKMMSRSANVHGLRSGIVTLLILGLAFAAREYYSTQKANSLVETLLRSEDSKVVDTIDDMKDYRRWVNRKLKSSLIQSEDDSGKRLRLSLAILPSDDSQVTYLTERLLSARPNELEPIRVSLQPYAQQLLEQVWNATSDDDKLLQSATALAAYDPKNTAEWSKIADRVADKLVKENALRAAIWMQLLEPAKEHLIGPLGKVFRCSSDEYSQTEIDLATNLLEDYNREDLGQLSNLLFDSRPKQFRALFEIFADYKDKAINQINAELDKTLPGDSKVLDEEKESFALRQANAAIAAIRMGQPERAWPLLKHSPDPRLRSWIVNRFHELGANPGSVVDQLESEADVSICRSLILMLGAFELDDLNDGQTVGNQLIKLYRTSPDPGIHGATRFTLSQWGMLDKLNAIDVELAGKIEADRQWYVSETNLHTMTIIEGPIEFEMGSPESEQGRDAIDETLHPVRINRSYAIASTEVTVEQYRKFSAATGIEIADSISAPDLQCPQVLVTWFIAAQYCRWLSEQEGFPENQMCYPPIEEIKPGMKLFEDMLERPGYRLPTDSEWEFAVRAGSMTSRFYGETEDLLARYAWFDDTSDERTWPVATLQPNDLGLFDVYGNVFEWVQQPRTQHQPGILIEDGLETDRVEALGLRGLRSASFDYPSRYQRSAHRNEDLPTKVDAPNGFRIVRTIDRSSK